MAVHNAEGAEENALYKTDEFRMYCFKVLPCSKRFCHDWTKCPFAHPGEKARRRDPRVYKYSGIPCPEAKAERDCPRSSGCPYAHSIFEYWLHPSRYRTQPCNDGTTCTRNVCFFAHTLEELRIPFNSNCSGKAGGSKSTNVHFVAKMPPSADEESCNKENGTTRTLGEAIRVQPRPYRSQLMKRQLHLSNRSFSMDATNNAITTTPRLGRPEPFLQSWEDGIPSWSMCGASDGRPFVQGIILDENIENLAKMTYEMGIKETLAPHNYEHPPRSIPVQLASSSLRNFPQAIAARSVFPSACHSRLWAQVPTNGAVKNRSFGGYAHHENMPESFLPVQYQASTDPLLYPHWQTITSQQTANSLQRTQVLDRGELSSTDPVVSCHIPCYALSHGILGESAWNRQAENNSQK